MIYRWTKLAGLAITLLAGATSGGGEIRLNQVQVIGTHNSYHIAPHPSVMKFIAEGGRGRAEGLDYTHRPLADQFSRLNIRQIELDVLADPEGGHYANPSARAILRGLGKDPGPDPDADGRLRRPGFKVLHVPDVDYLSTVATFAEALTQVRDWSASNKTHAPILILVELKEGASPLLPTRPVSFGKAGLDAVDAAILAAFGREDIITPDDVRGDSKTLPEALRTRGWPTLDACRGKVMFALDNEDALRDLYLEGHEALRGRMMFVSVAPEHPAAAWMKRNDPIADFDGIRDLVRAGFLVRTRADSNTVQSREDDPTMRDKALASGAQFVSTDYPEPDARLSGYHVRLPGGVAVRANPVNGPTTAADLEASPAPSK